MQRLSKIIMGVTLGIISLMVVFTVALNLLFDPSDYKVQIENAVNQHTDLQLSINGDISWSIFPWLGLNIQSLVLTLPHDDNEETQLPFLSLEQVAIKIKAIPLLSQQIEMRGLSLNHARMNLRTNQHGQANWHALIPSNTDATDIETISNIGAAFAGIGVAIKNIAINDAEIIFDNQQTQQRTIISDLQFTSTDINFGDSFPIKFTSTLQQSHDNNVSWQSNIALNADFLINPSEGIIELRDSELEGELSHSLLNQTIDLEFHNHLIVNLANNHINIPQWQFTAAGIHVYGQLQARDILTQPIFTGSLSTDNFNVKKILNRLSININSRNSQVLNHSKVTADIGGKANQFLLQNINWMLDSTVINGRLGINDIDSGQWLAELQIDQLNLDDYLSDDNDDLFSNLSKKSLLSAAQRQLLQQLDLTTDIVINDLQLLNIIMQSVELSLQADHGLIQFKHLKGHVYDGQFVDSGTLDTRGDIINFEINETVSQVNLDPLLMAYFQIQQPLVSGTLTAKSQLFSHGNSAYDLANNITGTMHATVDQGHLRFVNIGQLSCNAISTVTQQESPSTAWPEHSVFSQLNADLTLQGAAINVEQLTIAESILSTQGAGNMQLNNATFDTSTFSTLALNSQTNCPIATDFIGREIPLICSGNFHDSPATWCEVDINGLIQLWNNIKKQKVLDKYKQKLEETFQESFIQ